VSLPSLPDPNEPLDPELDALLQTWAEAEADDVTPLLVLADWLEERNDPRAELMRIVADPSARWSRHQEWFRTYWSDVMASTSVWHHLDDKTSLSVGNEFIENPIHPSASPLLRQGWIHGLEASSESTNWLGDSLPFGRIRYLHLHHVPATNEAMLGLIGCRNLRSLQLDKSPFLAEQLALLKTLPRLNSIRFEQLTDLGFSYADIGDRTAERLAELPRLESLSLFETEITQTGLATLRNLPKLKKLRLICPGEPDAVAEICSGLQGLRSLSLQSCSITDRGLNFLTERLRLKELWLESDAITDESVRKLVSMEGLTRLVLHDASVTHATVLELAALRELRHFRIDMSLIDDQMVWALSHFPMLDFLDVPARVSDIALQYLPRMKNLRRIRFNRSQITDYGILRYLASMRWLDSITFANTSVTAKGVAKLRKGLPKCEIEYERYTWPR
jgi:uncharacterized protein (TIGR02996 family)